MWQSVETYHQHHNYYYKWWLFVLQYFHNKTQSLQKILHFTLLLKFVLDNITSIRSPILFRHNKLLLCSYECKISLINITKSSWLIQFFMAKTMVPWNYVVIVLHIFFLWNDRQCKRILRLILSHKGLEFTLFYTSKFK